MRTDTSLGDLGLSMPFIPIDPHWHHQVYVVIRPMNSEGFDVAREEWVYLDSVEDAEHLVPVVQVLAEMKINGQCCDVSRWDEDTKAT